jgi:hypothetical protein
LYTHPLQPSMHEKLGVVNRSEIKLQPRPSTNLDHPDYYE